MKKEKGFTLIELLAVIVILGLLMAIAIPSVTKYITQSRKKTVTTTIGNYISALTNQVNDMEYVFTGTNTVYAVPIECIALERGGTNPFGKWHQASNAYWAYVLVQYDDNTSSYTYGFTFKDSAGYGLYPTTSEKLNENGSQIQTGLNLTRPTGGTISNITVKDNWLGFDVDNNTSLVVLEATSEGETGNGTTTCTLCQKGDNYSEVENEKKDKYKIGREVCFEDQCFYIIGSDTSTVSLLSKYNINPNLNNPVQNASASGINFSSTYYWYSGGLKPQYGTSFPVEVYDSNSNLYSYLEVYESYLIGIGVESVSVKLMMLDDLARLGCNNSTCNGTGYSFLKATNISYWLGNATSQYNVVNMNINYGYGGNDYRSNFGIRPLIVVDKTEIS